jgi:hypothetical protein
MESCRLISYQATGGARAGFVAVRRVAQYTGAQVWPRCRRPVA